LSSPTRNTRITHSEDGFDFLGQTVRRYRDGKVLSKPSKKNVKTFLAKIREVIREQGGHCSAGQLIQALNPKIKGWTMYHRHGCSKRTFSYVDSRIFNMLWRWCRRRHRQKSRKWIKAKYFRRVGNRDWVFMGIVRDSKGNAHPICLMEAAGVRIVRHVQIRGDANPYDPAWEGYFEERLFRKMQSTLRGRDRIYLLWKGQQGRCPACGQLMQEDEPWHVHHKVKRSQGGSDNLDNLELFHSNCHQQLHSQEAGAEADCVSQEALEEA